MYILTYVCERFIRKEFNLNKKGKFQYILSTSIRKNWLLGKVALSAGGISRDSCPSYGKEKKKGGGYSLTTSKSTKQTIVDDAVSFSNEYN